MAVSSSKTDVLSDWRSRAVAMRRPPAATFAVRLDEELVKTIKRLAETYSVSASQLVRSWIVERLKIEAEAGGLAPLGSQFPDDTERSVRKEVIQTVMEEVPLLVDRVAKELFSRMDREVEFLADGISGLK